MKSFQELSLPTPIERALNELKFETPTPIQAEAIPVILSGEDVIGTAQTGTGKTAAFSIPTLARLIANTSEDALVLVPTRELAKQVTDVMRALSKYMVNFRIIDLIGGVSMQPQNRAIEKGFRIIVATPGRLVDHLERKPKLLSRVSLLTLDEADRMLDMGFMPQLKQVFKYLPEKRQTLLFSATLPQQIVKLSQALLKDPVRVQVGEVSKAVPQIAQQIKHVDPKKKNDTLLDEINARQGTLLVFARTQRRTDRVTRFLTEYGLSAVSIHGGRTQGQRNRAIAGFRDGTFRIMVATDIAARGIDIDHVAHVINYDLPEQAEDYVHRIGRTARAGRSGEAISLISPEEQVLWKDIQRLLGGASVETKNTPVASRPAAQKTPSQPQRHKQNPHRGQRQAQPQSEKTPAAPSGFMAKRPVPQNIRFKSHGRGFSDRRPGRI